MIGGFTLTYCILLCLVTGWLLLRYDARMLASSNMSKENKVARFTGWFNLATGLGLTILNWVT